ncbi:MAG TPA: phenylalanine--tRNA ligase subunit beta [Solirubrobacteraceae bacterium]|nr:phenylalanine--tRNA ligase subunit beta [Solirubrobacteraceae bacterium]
MLIPLEWLREYCDAPLDTTELAARMTLRGVKVERTFRYGPPSAEHYVVGHVLEAVQHPNADRLRVCTVDVGGPGPSTIVCGAPNVAAGQTVAVARPGAAMADGRTLGAAKLRGVLSEGMILATDEIALGGDHAGILVLDDGAAPGTPLAEVLPLGTDVLEFEITPNRPDCLSVYGVAREVHAATGAPLAPPPWTDDPGSLDGSPAGIEIAVECPDLCPRFTARVFEDVAIGPSPLWLVARLLAAGMRPISNVVDITNYAMHLTGQPMHAFDLDRIAGASLTVRRANAGETVATLDGATQTLREGMIVIADAEGPTSLAGIMGGSRSEVGEGSTRVLLEAANWDGATVQRTSVALGVRSEASARFEKGLSQLSPLEGQAVASALMIELCGARLVPGTVDVGGPGVGPAPIRLRPQRVAELLGTEIPAERCAEILGSLGFEVSDDLVVGVPHWRTGDVTREVDLIEEVARIDGLERLPATLPPRQGVAGRLTHAQRLRRRAEDALAARGVSEIAGWTFAEPALLERLRLGEEHPMRRVLAIKNPLSESLSLLRPTLLGSLLDAAAHNAARDAGALALFESGTVFRASTGGDGLADEHHGLAVLLCGGAERASWRASGPAPADFYAAKGLLEAVLEVAGVQWELGACDEPFLHPGASANISSGDVALGFIGEVHPLVCRAWELDRAAFWAIDLGRLAAVAQDVVAYRAFGEFPAVREDLAVVVAEGVSAASVIAAIRSAGGASLASVEVFDVYRGAQVGEGRVSLALHLEFRAEDRTLTDEDVAAAREQIAAALREAVGGELRA